jgi:CDP-L-myo-inositol myo-inositolphosphotransferase
MKCVIIAAGRGERLSSKCDSKPLLPLLGLSLIDRVILTAHKAGIDEFYVITGYNRKKVEDHLDEFSRLRNIKITCIPNEDWEKGNALSVLKAASVIRGSPFLLLMTDHLFDKTILDDLIKTPLASDEIILAVDCSISKNKLINASDATKVQTRNGKIIDIGKNISNYDAYDTGIFFCSTAIFSAIEKSIKKGDYSLSGGVRQLAENGKAKIFDIKGRFWIDIDDETTYKKAEHTLLKSLKKPTDGPISRYINRQVSIRISKLLVRTKLTPNQISFISFLMCFISAGLIAQSGYLFLAIGAILAQFTSIIDGCDGEVARLKFQTTEFGAWFDAVLDRYGDAIILFGLISHLYIDKPNFIILLVGFLAIMGTFMNSYTADKYDGIMQKRIGKKGHYFRIGRDVRLGIIFVGGLANLPLTTLWLLAILTNFEAIRRIFMFRREEKIER